MRIIETRNVNINANFTRRNGLNADWHICAILKETEKACNVVAYRFPNGVKAMWVPKACIEEASRECDVMVDCDFKKAIGYGWNRIRLYS